MRRRGEKERVSESCAFSADFEWRRRGRRRPKKEAEAAKEVEREGGGGCGRGAQIKCGSLSR